MGLMLKSDSEKISAGLTLKRSTYCTTAMDIECEEIFKTKYQDISTPFFSNSGYYFDKYNVMHLLTGK